MGLYAGNDNWPEQVYLFEETDLVQGGEDGTDNVPIKQLSDRTTYLFERMGIATHLNGDIQKVANDSITNEDIGKLIVAIGNDTTPIQINTAAEFPHGTIIPITSYCNSNSVINIQCSDGQKIYDYEGLRDKMLMHNKEHLILVSLTDHFKVVNASGNFYSAGEEVKARKQLNNTLRLQGQLLSRALYPRLWEFVQSLTFGQEVVSEATWFSHPVTYRGFFTIGDGLTTFRLPDERGMFDRMIDAGRGLDIGRVTNYPGGYEADGIKSHNLTVENMSRRGWPRQSGDRTDDYYFIDKSRDTAPFYKPLAVSYNGLEETRSKNIGKLNLIKY